MGPLSLSSVLRVSRSQIDFYIFKPKPYCYYKATEYVPRLRTWPFIKGENNAFSNQFQQQQEIRLKKKLKKRRVNNAFLIHLW